jgi:lambda family phage portal protein
MNVLDRAISAVAPSWGARRAQARLEAAAADVRRQLVQGLAREGTALDFSGHYLDGARRDRTSADWAGTAVSADGGIIPDVGLMNARARAAVANDWSARSIVGMYRRHVVGIGITARSAARDPETGEETEVFQRFNQRIDALFDFWGHRPWLCDTERTKNIVEIDGLAVADLATVGQSFCVHTFSPRRGNVGMAIQMFEAEQLDWTLTRNSDNGNEIRGGVEIDGQGVTAAFWLFTGAHPLDGQFYTGHGSRSSTRLPADRVYHLIRQERVRQTHGLSQFSAVLEDIYQLKGYKQAEAVGKRLDACIGLKKRYEQWYNPSDGPGGYPGLGTVPAGGSGATDSRGNPKLRFEPGMVADPGYGMYYESHVSQRPGAQYDSYVNRQTDQISAGAGGDSSHVSRNFNDGTYTSQRQGSLELDREMDPIQVNLVIDQWARPRREAFKLYAAVQGLVETPGMFEDDGLMMAYLAEDWAGPPKPWVDPRNQAQATHIALEDGITDLRHERRIVSGGDYREAIHQRASEQELADAEGVDLPWLHPSKPGTGPGSAGLRRGEDQGPGNGNDTGDDSGTGDRGPGTGNNNDQGGNRQKKQQGAGRAS